MAGPRYDLHLHSCASSDCRTTYESLIEMTRQRGLAGIALTDHDTMEGFYRLSALWPHEEMDLIPGCERTLFDKSHLIGLFLTECPKSDQPRMVIEEIRDQGGIVYLPHPYRAYSGLLRDGGGIPDVDRVWVLENCDIIEVYNSKCTPDENRRALKLADQYGKAFAAGSDAHVALDIGIACTEYDAPLTSESFIASAAYAPPADAMEKLATLRRGQEPAARAAVKNLLRATGLFSTAKALRDSFRRSTRPKLQRYR